MSKTNRILEAAKRKQANLQTRLAVFSARVEDDPRSAAEAAGSLINDAAELDAIELLIQLLETDTELEPDEQLKAIKGHFETEVLAMAASTVTSTNFARNQYQRARVASMASLLGFGGLLR